MIQRGYDTHLLAKHYDCISHVKIVSRLVELDLLILPPTTVCIENNQSKATLELVFATMASKITPVTEWPDYNVDPTGGDPITQDLNALYDKVIQSVNL